MLVLLAGSWLLQRERVRGIETVHEVEYGELIEILHRHPASRGAGLATFIKEQIGGDAALYYIRIHDHLSGTDQNRGHGLGLAICRGVAELHGGRIHAENRSDGRTGLRVVVKLPR